ncbi:hypothetical protein LINPERPRIM_LOCUS38897 [Linum perenne]
MVLRDVLSRPNGLTVPKNKLTCTTLNFFKQCVKQLTNTIN